MDLEYTYIKYKLLYYMITNIIVRVVLYNITTTNISPACITVNLDRYQQSGWMGQVRID